MESLKKQTVYFPVEITEEFWTKWDNDEKPDYDLSDVETGENIESWVNKKEGYFFTTEQLNGYTQSVIKQALETVTEKMYETFHTICEDGSTKGVFKTQKEALDFANILNNKTNLYHDWVKVTRLNGGMDKQSIKNTFEKTFKFFEV